MWKPLMILALALCAAFFESSDAQDTCGSPTTAPGDSMLAVGSNPGFLYFYPTAFDSSCVGTVVVYEFCYRYTPTSGGPPDDVVSIVVLESEGVNYRVVWTGDEREDRTCVTDTLFDVDRCCGRTDLAADEMFTVSTNHGYGFVIPASTQNSLLTLATSAPGYFLLAPALLTDPVNLPAVGSILTPADLGISAGVQTQNLQQRSVQFIIQPPSLPPVQPSPAPVQPSPEPVPPSPEPVPVVVIGFEQTVYNTTERVNAIIDMCVVVTSGTLERAVTVSFSTNDDTATLTAPADYMSTSMQLTFVPNNTRNCAAVLIIDDDILELTESFFATLTTTDSATTLAPDRARVNIFDDIEGNETEDGTSIVSIVVPTAVGASLLVGIAVVILILFTCHKKQKTFTVSEHLERNEAYITNIDSIPAAQNAAYGVTKLEGGNTLNREDTTDGAYHGVDQLHVGHDELSEQPTQQEDNVEHTYEYVH